MTAGALPAAIDSARDIWPNEAGTPVDCREKLRLLRENDAELSQVLRDAFDDAVLIGVDVAALRAHFHALVDGLRDPRRPSGAAS